jgi:gliding motility-associated-like protein
LQTPDILNPSVNPTTTTVYTLQSDIGVCTATDRVVVQVDSLPADMHIDIAPPKPYYCAGEIVALYSPSFDSLLYPDITFEWTPDNGTFLSDPDLLNAALQLQDTTTYKRRNINNGCSSLDSIVINVVPPSVPLSVTDTILCPGEMFTVEVLADNITSPEWTPATGLSCTECTVTKVTVMGEPGASLLYQFSGMILDCPVGANLSIHIPQPQQIFISGDTTICEGQTTELTITNPTGLVNFEWSITEGVGILSCNDCTNPTITVTDFNAADVVTLEVTAENSSGQKCGAFGKVTIHRGFDLIHNSIISACRGETVVAFPDSPNYTNVVWSVSTGDISLSCSNCPSPTVTAHTTGFIAYDAEAPGTDTCSVRGVVQVNIFGTLPPLDYEVQPQQPIGQGSEVSISISNVPPPPSVQWTVNGAVLPTTDPSIVFNANEDVNTILAKYINANGCEQTDTISVPTVSPNFMIPNAFTPDNGDEVNDHFRVIINGDLQLEEFLIFNRWGQLVYEAPAGDLLGWDGMWKEKPAPSDTYVYTAKLRYPDGRTEIAKGDVALLR